MNKAEALKVLEQELKNPKCDKTITNLFNEIYRKDMERYAIICGYDFTIRHDWDFRDAFKRKFPEVQHMNHFTKIFRQTRSKALEDAAVSERVKSKTDPGEVVPPNGVEMNIVVPFILGCVTAGLFRIGKAVLD